MTGLEVQMYGRAVAFVFSGSLLILYWVGFSQLDQGSQIFYHRRAP